MSRKKNKAGQTVSKRQKQFEQACDKRGLSPRDFFALAARLASPQVPQGSALNDFGKHEFAAKRGKFSAAHYVHDLIDLTLGLRSQPRKPDPARGYLSPKAGRQESRLHA